MKDIHIMVLSTVLAPELEKELNSQKIGMTVHGSALQRCGLMCTETQRVTLWCCVLNALTRQIVQTVLPYMDAIIIHYGDSPLSVIGTAAWVELCSKVATVEPSKILIITKRERKILPRLGEYEHARSTIINSVRYLVDSF